MRIAFISDIHGNRIALEAVLADIKCAGVDQIICLGDVANFGPHPETCLDLVSENCAVILQGNHELYMLGRFADDTWRTCPTWSVLRWSRQQMRPDQMQMMAELPLAYALPGNGRCPTTLVHASPLTQYVGFYAQQAEADIAKHMDGLDGVTLFCGHTHIPLYRRWSNTWIVNVGSVGMSLDDDPAAKYVIATQDKLGWAVEFRAVSYDLDHLMAEFDRVGLQQVGGVPAAICRYQMMTGHLIFDKYLVGLRERAAALNMVINDVYEQYPVPPEVRQWIGS